MEGVAADSAVYVRRGDKPLSRYSAFGTRDRAVSSSMAINHDQILLDSGSAEIFDATD